MKYTKSKKIVPKKIYLSPLKWNESKSKIQNEKIAAMPQTNTTTKIPMHISLK